MYRDEDYWGRPLPSFGDPEAELLILGLAPAAHGGNRTGRMFTGDRSGDFLYRALYDAGLSSSPYSRRRNDGLTLAGCYITATLRCAPPANKPRPAELLNCRPYLIREFELLTRARAVLALGRIAFDAYLRIALTGESLTAASLPRVSAAQPARRHSQSKTHAAAPSGISAPARSSFKFGHGAVYSLPGGWPRLYASYHPSQQNTQTGKLTREMFASVLHNIRQFLQRP